MSNSKKRVALVTGGGRGIGLGIARCLAEADFDLVINGRRAEADVAEKLDELQSRGARTLYCQADISELAHHASMLAAIAREFGRLDVLINNAGISSLQRADLLEATTESFDRVMNINLRGPFFLTQQVARWMIDQQQADSEFRAAIVNLSSISAQVVSVNRGDYCISKAGIAMATQLWATRLGEFGIPVYDVRPGIIRSDMTAGVTEKYEKLLAEGLTIEPRWGEPEDVGRAVALLASGKLSYATGAVLPIDGGLTIQRL